MREEALILLLKKYEVGNKFLSEIQKISLGDLIRIKIRTSLPMFPDIVVNFALKKYLDDLILFLLMEIAEEYFPNSMKNNQLPFHYRFLGVTVNEYKKMKKEYEKMKKTTLHGTQNDGTIGSLGNDATE